MEELDRVYGGKKSTETGMEFDAESGFIRPAGSVAHSHEPASTSNASPSTQPSADDDLLDLDEGSVSDDDDLLV